MNIQDDNMMKEIVSMQEVKQLKHKMFSRIVISLLIAAAISVVVAYFSLKFVAQSAINKTTSDIEAKFNTIYSLEINNIDFLKNIVFQLGADSELQRYVMVRNQLSKDFILDKWIRVSEQTKWISQIRFITSSGLEILRADYDRETGFSVSKDDLQNKKHRDYFKKSLELGANEIHISAIELNREYGELSYPLTPVILISTPVIESSGQLAGVLVVNYFADKLVDVANDILAGSTGGTVLVDHQGHYIQGLDNKKNWSHVISPEKTSLFSAEFPAVWQEMLNKQHGIVATENNNFVFRQLDFSANKGTSKPYVLIQHIANSEVAEEYSSQSQELLMLLFMVFILTALFIWIWFKRKFALEIEHRSLELISALFYSKEAIFITDNNWRVSVVNTAFCDATGYTRDEVNKMSCDQLYFFDEKDLLAEMAAAIEQAGHWYGEVQSVRKDGTKVANILFASAVKNRKGIVTDFVLQMVDISERKMMESELKVAAAAFETRSAISITDSDRNIIRVNQAFTDITGYQQEEVIGKNHRMFSSGRHNEEFYQRLWKSMNEHGVWQGEIYNKHKDGKIFPEWITISSIKDYTGIVIYYVSTFEDITERKHLEEQLAKIPPDLR